MSLTTGEIIESKYRIVRLIGEGGMGAVYEGENIRIHRRVAIKVLHAGVAENQEAVQRFEREAQAAGRIGNDHILEVIDLGTFANGDHFMVMEFLDGEPLSERIKRVGRMRPEDIAPLMIQVLEGLRAAHDAGIVHRDLKPDNVFVLKEKAGVRDFVKLIDFGISKFQPLGGEMKMTRTGTVMGTPYYMSPEQASGSREADHRSDLYAVGIMLYEAVTGRVPFDAPTFNQLLFQIVLSDPAPPQQVVPELDSAFANLIAKAMARDVEHRFQTASELAEAIAAWQKTGASVSVPPTAPINPLIRREAMGSAPMLELDSAAKARTVNGQTPDTWAASQILSPAGVPKSKAPLIAGLAASAVFIVGLGLGAYKLLGTSKGAAVTEQTATTTIVPVPQPSLAAAPAASQNTAQVAPVVEPAKPSVATAGSATPAAVSAAKSVAAPGGGNRPVPVVAAAKGAKPATAATATAPKGQGQRDPKPGAKPSGRGPSGPVDFGY